MNSMWRKQSLLPFFHCRKHTDNNNETLWKKIVQDFVCIQWLSGWQTSQWVKLFLPLHGITNIYKDKHCTRLAGIHVQCKPDNLWKRSSWVDNIQIAQTLHLALTLMFPFSDIIRTYRLLPKSSQCLISKHQSGNRQWSCKLLDS